MRTRISLFLAVLMLVPLFAACSGGGTNTPAETTASTGAAETTTAAPETKYIDTLEKRDFNGKKFTTIAQNTSSRQVFYMEEKEGDVINEALHERDAQTVERLNVTFENFGLENRGQVAQTLINAVTAGDAAYDMYVNCLSDGINTAATAGVLYDLKQIPHLSLEDSLYWNRSMWRNMQIYDRLYFTSGALAQCLYRTPIVIAYNKEMAADLKIPDLYSVVLDGKWTIDYMSTLFKDVSADVNGDGKMDDSDRWAMCIDGTWGNSLYTGAGYDSREITAAGEYRLTLGDEQALNLVEKCARIFGDRTKINNDLNGGRDLMNTVFKEGRALFVDLTTSAVMGLRDMEQDFGVLPNPKYVETQDEYYTACNTWLPSGVAVPKIVADAEATGLIMETMAYYSYEYLVPAVYEVTLRGKAARDSDSWKMLDIIFEGASFDFNTVFNFASSSDQFRASVIGEYENWTSNWASRKDAAQAALDNMLKFAKEG